MQDTPKHLDDIQLKIWLAKTPGERLKQFLIDNDALYNFWKKAKPVAPDEIDNPKKGKTYFTNTFFSPE